MVNGGRENKVVVPVLVLLEQLVNQCKIVWYLCQAKRVSAIEKNGSSVQDFDEMTDF